MIRKALKNIREDIHFSELIKGSLITFLLKAFGMALAFGVLKLIDEKTGNEGVGFYSLLNQLILTFGTLLCLGSNFSVLRYIGQYKNTEEEGRLKTLIRNIHVLILPVNILAGAGIFFFSGDIARLIFHHEEFKEVIGYLGVLFPLFTLSLLNVEIIRGMKRLQLSEFIRSVSRPLLISILILVFWKKEITILDLGLFFTVSVLLNYLLSLFPVYSFASRLKDQHSRRPGKKEILFTSFPMMVTGASTIIMSSVTLYLLEYFEGMGSVGIFSVAVRISVFISIILIVVNTIAGPKFAELFWSDRIEELQKVIIQSAKLMFWISLLTSALIILLAPWILGLFGTDYQDEELELTILAIGQFINVSSGSVGLFLNMSGNQRFLQNTSIMAILISVVSCMILIPYYGTMGAAISTAATNIIWNFVNIIYTQKKLNIQTYYLPFLNR